MPQRPEIRLLICLSRARLEDSHEQNARTLLESPLDELFLRTSAVAHGVAGLCYARLQELRQKGLDTPAELFEDSARTIASRSLLLASRLVRLLNRFAETGLQAVPYKGPVLAMMSYGNLAARDYVDLDLIVRHRDLAQAWQVLESEGYQPEPSIAGLGPDSGRIPGQYEFSPPARDFLVEVHTERTLRHFPRPLPAERIFANLRTVDLLGHAVWTFSPTDTLIFLCVHHAKDYWSRLIWLADVSELVTLGAFDWEEALLRAQALGCQRMVRTGVLLIHELLGTRIPADVLRQAQSDSMAQRQAAWLAAHLFTAEPIGRWDQLRYRMRMVEGFWPGARYVARLATTPAADDWKRTPLPAPLEFAYALLRPLRLLRR